MKKLLQAFLVLAVVAVLSHDAKAVWDSTGGNMPQNYPLCWGLGQLGATSNACIYGNSQSDYLRVQNNGSDVIAVTAGQVGIGTNSPTNILTVSGNQNVTGNLTVTGNLIPTSTVLSVNTTAQLEALTAPTIGTVSLVEEYGIVSAALEPGTFNVCAATAAAIDSFVYIAVSTNTNGSATHAQLGVSCVQ